MDILRQSDVELLAQLDSDFAKRRFGSAGRAKAAQMRAIRKLRAALLEFAELHPDQEVTIDIRQLRPISPGDHNQPPRR